MREGESAVQGGANINRENGEMYGDFGRKILWLCSRGNTWRSNCIGVEVRYRLSICCWTERDPRSFTLV